MNCDEVKLRLEPYTGGTVEGDEKRALEEHLSLCEGCRLELELRQAIQSTPPLGPQLDFGDRALGGDETPVLPAPAAPPAASGPAPPVDPVPAAEPAEGDASEISFADLAMEMPTLVTETAQETASPPPPPAAVTGRLPSRRRPRGASTSRTRRWTGSARRS